jgi:hypothetical protein
MVVVWHVTSIKKFFKYLQTGRIKAPVRAWLDIEEAERFSKQTGRQIILRLKFDENEMRRLPEHKGKAVYTFRDYDILDWFYNENRGGLGNGCKIVKFPKS